MRRLIITLAAALAMLLGQPEHSRSQPISIGENPGGNVARVALEVKEAMRRGDTAKIHGRCYSACTMWLAVAECIYPGAVLGFHAAYHEKTGEPAPSATAYMLTFYPDWVKEWIISNGDGGLRLPRRMIYMKYQYASQFLPTCDGFRDPNLL